ncbi:unnamed protein product, partial [Prorocentrum cordatum]
WLILLPPLCWPRGVGTPLLHTGYPGDPGAPRAPRAAGPSPAGSYGGSVGVSQRTAQHPWLTRLLAGALCAEMPDFPFTSIQLNYNYASRPHVDKNNLGASVIVGFGDYDGGELWVHDAEGDEELVLGG